MLLVYTHVVCERLSAMQEQARLPEFLVQNSLSAPTQVFQECWSALPLTPPPPMKIWTDLGTLDLSWSGLPPLWWKFGQILALWILVGLDYPHPNKNLARCWHFGFKLVWITSPPEIMRWGPYHGQKRLSHVIFLKQV